MGRDAYTIIDHINLKLVTTVTRADHNTRTLQRVFFCIINHIGDRLQQQIFITPYRSICSVELQLQGTITLLHF
jgi:hypothetical protein